MKFSISACKSTIFKYDVWWRQDIARSKGVVASDPPINSGGGFIKSSFTNSFNQVKAGIKPIEYY